MNDNTDIQELIIKSLTDTISQSERALLDAWKAESRANFLEYTDYETIWKESGRLASAGAADISASYKIIRKKARLDRNQRIPAWLNIAAILVLSLVFSGLYQMFTRTAPDIAYPQTVYHEIQATYGTQSRLRLPDGTTVHLNSGSTLKYPVTFDHSDERRIELSGEGFFEVENQDKPFIVDAGKLQIEVTGTRFNVDAYPENSNITVALVEGEVNLVSSTTSGSKRLATLKPGEVSKLAADKSNLYISEVADLIKYYAWTEGKIVFMDDPIQVVVEKLSNWYNVDIEIADRTLDRYRFTGTFIDEPVEQILTILSRTSPMGYSIVSSKKLADNTYTKRRIILKSK